ncbi:MAG: [LysW]-aminoadipate/[LysW]-glutamate kinase [Nitrososphaerota archaeon]
MLVVKAGGRVLASNMENIAKSIVRVWQRDEKIVFVHGGGDMVSEMCKRLGIEPKFVVSPSGIRSRYTDEAELDVYVQIMAGKLNKKIISTIQRLGGRAIGLTGADAGLLVAERKKKIIIVDEHGRKRIIDGGYTGQVKLVNHSILELLTNNGYIVVVSPIAIGLEGELLNVDGDQAAAIIAKSLNADMLVLMTDVDGVLYNGKLVERLNPQEATELAAKIGPGMNRKLMLAAEAVQGGAKQALICSGLGDDPIENISSMKGTLIRT